MPGSLFVFEGPDGVGKTTLSHGLYSHLCKKNISCEYFSFPGREEGTIGYHIYDLHHNLSRYNVGSISPLALQTLHIAAHIDAIERQILPALADDKVVILDRFWWSTFVYGVTSGIQPRLLKAVIEPEILFWGNYLPRDVFIITRGSPLRPESDIKRWNNLCAGYYELSNEQKTRHSVHTVNNDGEIEIALKKIIQYTENALLYDVSPDDVKENPQIQQLTLKLFGENTKPQKKIRAAVINSLAPATTTEVYQTYWYFAAERQGIFFKRFKGDKAPWTSDPILQEYKFTNAYRASDRVSQYLIKNVIYTGDQSADEVFFRILLFKIFNNIETWERFVEILGEVSYAEYNFETYDRILTIAQEKSSTIFSAAYIMPSGNTVFGYSKKHRNYLKLLEKMMSDDVPAQICNMRTMREGFELLRSYPLIGDFLAYQYISDINYSEMTDFSEMEFVVPGPGALSGIHKCFNSLGGLNESDIIRMMAEKQEQEFERLELSFQSLWGRPLQLIDCQNLFCEVDKYSRVAHPEILGVSKRTRIKQRYKAIIQDKIEYWYPPKWNINKHIKTSKKR